MDKFHAATSEIYNIYIYISSNGLDMGSIGVGVAVEVLKRCRGDVGGKAPSILTFTPR